MRHITAIRWLWIIGFLFAYAATGLVLELESFKVVKVKTEEGKELERLIPAAEVKPGDVLEWVLTAKNEGKAPLKQVALTIPIPPETFYLEGSAKPLKLGDVLVEPLFSYDGKRFARPPLIKKVRVKQGDEWVEKELVVPPEEYSHVRWVVPVIEPGQQVQVRLRTQVR